MATGNKNSQAPTPLALTLNVSAKLTRLVALTLAAVLTLAIMAIAPTTMKTVEERVGSLGWALAPASNLEERVVIVAVDEKSLAQIGPWPWPREVLAFLSSTLSEAGVSLQAYDIVFPEQKAGDKDLISVFKANEAIIGQIPVLNAEQPLQAGRLTHPIEGMRCQPGLPATQNYLGSHRVFSSITKGHITPHVDADGMVRSVPALICVDGNAYPSLALRVMTAAFNIKDKDLYLETGQGLTSAPLTIKAQNHPALAVPLDERGNMRINYSQSPASYQVVSAIDVLSGEVPQTLLDNAWVLVGATAFGLNDIVPTPHSGTTPGVELQARLITALLDNNTPFTPQHTYLYLIILSGLFGAIILVLASGQGKWTTVGLPAAGLALPVIAILLHLQLLDSQNMWLGWIAPSVFAIAATVLLSALEHARVRMERGRVYDNLSSYLPNDVAVEIAFNLPSGAVEAERKNITLLSADIRNFSAFEESRPPEESAALLHCFFVQATEIIENNGGSVQEYKGDSLLAIWTDSDQPSAVQNAMKAAQTLQESQASMLPTSTLTELEPLALGIGIEQGPALIGSIGPAHRRTHTLLGDTVTITLRIQEMTEELAQPILIGECAARQLAGAAIQSQGSYLLNGLRTPHTLFAPLTDTNIAETDNEQSAQPLKVLKGGRF